jgi:hypothetical protein
MNAMNKETMMERHVWRELNAVELGAVEGGSPSLPLPPPIALVLDPEPSPWRSVVPVVSLGGYFTPTNPWPW